MSTDWVQFIAWAAAALSIALIGRLVLRWIQNRRRERFFQVVIENNDQVYEQMLVWLSSRGVFDKVRHKRSLRMLRQATEEELANEHELQRLKPEDANAPRYLLSLAPNNDCVKIEIDGVRARIHGRVGSDVFPGASFRYEALEITFPGLTPEEGERVFTKWRRAAAPVREITDDFRPTVYTLGMNGWDYRGEVRRRRLDTVVTADDVGEQLVEDLRRFQSRSDWYAQRAIPWRRGYLLFGPPGTGKSSLIRAAASEAKMDLAIIDLSKRNLGDGDLRDALSEAPDDTAIVFEDIDAAFVGRDRPEHADNTVTFSGILNALDGLASPEGLVVFMTTNRIDDLDPALIRPGRVDRQFELTLAGAHSAAELYRLFFPDETARAGVLAGRLSGRRAPAEIQGALLEHAEDAAAAQAAIEALYARG